MNLPNKLTLLRVLLIPLFVLVFYIPHLNERTLLLFDLPVRLSYIVGVLIFVLASVTDFLDGNLARRRNLVTNFGKLMDPLADKMLVMSALFILTEMKLLPAFCAIIIIGREFLVTGVRQLAVGEGIVIAASKLAKAKTISQIVMIIALFLLPIERQDLFEYVNGQMIQGVIVDTLIIVTTVLTLISGFDYVFKNRGMILASK